MKFGHFFALYLIVLLCVAMPIFFRTNINTKNEQLNNDYSSYLTSAAQSALESAVLEDAQSEYLFAQKSARIGAVDAFYKTLIECFNYEYSTYEDLVYTFIPCIVLVDTDGFYIEYGEDFLDENGVFVTSDIITPIHKWIQGFTYSPSVNEIHKYTVEYRLDDTVSITSILNNKIVDTYEGCYSDVEGFMRDAGEEIDNAKPDEYVNAATLGELLGSYKSFYNEKREVVISEIEEQLTYYINTKWETNNQNGKYQYKFTLPKNTGTNWARMVDAPTVLSFMQGPETVYGTSRYNVYALSGTEIETDYDYFIVNVNGEPYYHRKNCDYLSGIDTDGMRSYSMKEAAKLGAYPCLKCIY